MPHRRNPLLDLVTRLGDAATWEEVQEIVLTRAGSSVGSHGTTLALTNRTGTHLDVFTPSSPSIPSAVVDLHAESTLAKTILEGHPVVLSGVAITPGILDSLQLSPDTTAIIAVPLVGAEGAAGGVAFGYSDRTDVASADTDRAILVGRWIGRAFEHTRYQEQGRLFVDGLREELTHHASAPRGLSVHGAYRPPWAGEPLGGDWFDTFTGMGGAGIAVVGDVAGHGITASPTMIAMRSYLRALAFQDPDPHRVLNAADQLLTEFDREAGLVTMTLGVFEVEEGQLTIVNAGMPPPILRSHDGTVTVIDGGRSRVLGSGLEREHEEPVRVAFQSGDTIVFFTDGVLVPLPNSGVEISDIVGIMRNHGGDELESLVLAILDPPHRGTVRLDDATALAVRATGDV